MKFIVNNKSDLVDSLAFMLVQKVIDGERPFKTFNDYTAFGKSYTCVYVKNASSIRLTVYNEHTPCTENQL